MPIKYIQPFLASLSGLMNGGPSKLVFGNGVKEANISVHIYDDNVAEPMEQFEVGLTIQNAIGNGGVTIGENDRTLITIGKFLTYLYTCINIVCLIFHIR